ncbi:transposase [Tissierella praeacuta]|uniref:transposase n=1 Tax=Tissierella praeacuta TaxID=43131 RepID=UPI00333F4C04
MGRKPRIEYYGAIYHIIQRGNNRAFIFEESEEKVELLKILGELREVFDFHLLAYVIMDNHYHFVIKTHNIPISQIMHRINSRYAKYYNWKNERTGSLFEGRYKSILVQNESYLFRLIKYIHNNPVYASICDNMVKYKWSSDAFYRMNVDNLVNINELLDIFSQNRMEAIHKYNELMDEPVEDYMISKEEFEDKEVIGTEEFRKSLEEDKNIVSLDNILKIFCPTNLDYKLIKSGSRKRYLLKYKYEYAYEALSQGYTTKEIGRNISITGGAIRKILNERNIY